MLDNVGFHKSERAEQIVKAIGAWLLLLPPCSPVLPTSIRLKCLLQVQGAPTQAS
ncbi:hypothetical protein [Ensifer aridi]|uniref:hypothetical protein n=1 Tax=Ensifer aridi TaxID=1708715 RepID=UPI0009BDFD1B